MCKKLPCLVSLVLAFSLAASVANADALVGHWKFDEGSGNAANDSSGNGNHGTLEGNPQWVAGKVGQAIDLDGVDDHVVVPHSAELVFGPSDSFTVSVWLNVQTLPGQWAGIVAKSRDMSPWYGLWITPSNQWHFVGGEGGANVRMDVGSVDAGVWHHVVGLYDADAHIQRLYVDGQVVGENSGVTIATSGAGDLWFGGANSVDEYLDASIDDVLIYNRALRADQVQDLLNGITPRWVKAEKPDPPDGAEGVTQPLLTWQAGDTAASHDVYFGTNPTPGPDEYIGRQGFLVYWHTPGLTPGTTYYWRIDEVEADGTTIYEGDVWSFTAPALTGWDPTPADGATDVASDVTVSWKAGWGAVMYHVYFSDNFDAVNDGTAEADVGIMTETSYAPGLLRGDSIYYWRVDAFDGTAWHTGDVWSFTTVSAGTGRILREWWDVGGTDIGTLTSHPDYPDNPHGREYVDIFEGPVDWRDNYGSRLRGWLFAPATGDYTFWISTDDNGQLWLSTDEDPTNKQLIASEDSWTDTRVWEDGNERSSPISLEEGKVYYIEAIMNEGGGGDNIAVAWQGGPIATRTIISAEYVGQTPFPPLKAYSPRPGDGATDVTEAAVLGWLAGERAAQHDVYLGTDATAVANADTTTAAIYRGRQALAATTYLPLESPLQWDTTYYWRIDEINTADPEGPWKGNVWSFTTANYIIVENFEAYDDFCDRIFYTWTDGWGHSGDVDCGVAPYGGNGTGSTVGNLSAPFAEQTIIHGGSQSMPFEYDNSRTPFYSETVRVLAVVQNWARNDVKALTLWFYGDPGNSAERLYVAVEDSTGQVRVASHAEPEAVQRAAWQQWNIELSQFSGVNLAAVKKLYIGMGNRVSPAAGGTGKIYIDDIRVYQARCVPSLAKPDADLSGNCIVDAADVEMIVDQWLNSGFIVTPADPGTLGLVARYPFNGNANDVVGGHHGTTSGLVSYAAGKIGQAILLDGVDDLVVVGSVGISGAVPRTISGWAKANALVDSLPNWINIFGFTGPAGDNGHFDIEVGEAQGSRGYVVHVYGWERVIMPIDFDWHHLAASYDGTTIKWYGDGQLIGTDSSRTLNTPDNVHMGKREDYENYFPGRVDEVRIFNRALSDAEVAYLAGHTSPFSIPEDMHQDDVIDFKDLAVLGDAWLEEILWP